MRSVAGYLKLVGECLAPSVGGHRCRAAATVFAALVVGLLVVGDTTTVGAREYSAYSDPEKPVLSYLLAGEQNVGEFQKEFNLTDGQVREVLAAVRRQNAALSEEYEKSERIVDSGASKERIADEIAASDFDESVRRTVARTKSDVKGILPADRRADLKPWVDEQWRQETAQYGTDGGTSYRISATGYSCEVWATYYDGYTRYEVAIPHKKFKLEGGYRVRITVVSKGTRAWAPVKEVGPWNTRDNYWASRKSRSMWRDLPRCTPEAAAAYYHNYNRGKDQFGREVLNPAGFDMTIAVAHQLKVRDKIRRQGRIKVRIYYPWVRR